MLPDGETQVYSSVLHDGWAVCAVFNGVYKRTFDHETNPETQTFVDDWIALETRRGPRPQVLPTKEQRRLDAAELFVNAADQSALGEVEVVIEHEPLSLRRARQQVTWAGALERSYAFERVRDGARTQYEGPDVLGNATSYGRALFTSQHLRRGRARRREDQGPRGADRRRTPATSPSSGSSSAATPRPTSCTACSPGRRA